MKMKASRVFYSKMMIGPILYRGKIHEVMNLPILLILSIKLLWSIFGLLKNLSVFSFNWFRTFETKFLEHPDITSSLECRLASNSQQIHHISIFKWLSMPLDPSTRTNVQSWDKRGNTLAKYRIWCGIPNDIWVGHPCVPPYMYHHIFLF